MIEGRQASGAVVLLTGATGFLGKVVLEELMRRRQTLDLARVRVLVRAVDDERADSRLRSEIIRSPCFTAHPPGWEKSVEAVAADLAEPDCALSAEARARLAADTTHVIHCAASVEFDLPLREATRANVTAALETQALAESCPGVDSMVSVSTAYVTPHGGSAGVTTVEEALASLPWSAETALAEVEAGGISERDGLAASGHPNTYTWTKCLAEHLLLDRRRRVPLTLLRPSIISGSRRRPEPGWIDSPAAFAAFVMMLGTGQLRAVCGDPDTRLDLVPCDEVARRVVDAAFAPPPDQRILHAVAGLANACPIELCGERILAYFNANPVLGGPRLGFVGRQGPRFLLEDWLRHRLPGAAARLWLASTRQTGRARAAERLAERQQAIHRDFAYFTHNTFDFRSSAPLAGNFDRAAYLDDVCAGVHRNLLQRRKRLPRPRMAEAS